MVKPEKVTFIKKYFFTSIFLLSFFTIDGQEIDPSIISQLSEEQLEIAKSVLDENSINIVNDVEDIPPLVETLQSNEQEITTDNTQIKKYGYDFFTTMATSVSATGDLPLPNDYKISLRDQLSVILSGSKDAIFTLDVKLDGTILFPELGSISVVGKSFEEVKKILSVMIDKSYIGVDIDISIKNLSAKKISIVGAVKTPGTYLVNPFSTITSALAYSGGVLEIGSLRNIKLIRNDGNIFSFDLYDFLIKGDRSDDITIEAGDTILVDAASQFVEIRGAVKRPGIYEILDNENLENLLEYSLGFTKVANTSNVSLKILDLKKLSIIEKTTSNLEYNLANTLAVNIFEYKSDEKSNILVLGAVEKPGFYSIENYNNLNDLINDLTFVDVYPWVAVLEQFDEASLTNYSILFSLKDPDTYQSIKLLPNSKIFFADINEPEFSVSEKSKELIDEYKLIINHKQSEYDFPVYGKYSLMSFVNLEGLDMSNINEIATYISPIENIVENKEYYNMQYSAQKFNTIIFKSPVNDLIKVNILGAVNYPGTYTLSPDNTLQDLYKLIGGFKSEAFEEGIIFKRESVRNRQLDAINRSKSDINNAVLTTMQQGNKTIDLDILQSLSIEIDPNNLGRIAGDFSPSSDSAKKTILFDGDSIFVPKNPNIINVLGEVLNPTAFEFSKNISIDNAIRNAGGFKTLADKRKVYVIKSNGLVAKPGRNIFLGTINLEPGDTIIVPKKIILSDSGIQALVPLTQLLSDLAFSAAAIESLSNN